MDQPLIKPNKDGAWLRVVFYNTEGKATPQAHSHQLIFIAGGLVADFVSRGRYNEPMKAWMLDEYLAAANANSSTHMFYYLGPTMPNMDDTKPKEEHTAEERFEEIG